MAISTVTQASGLDFGLILKIMSKGMIYDNLSTVSPMWDYVYGKKTDVVEGRELRYDIRTSLGPSAGGFIGMKGAQMPASQKATLVEGIVDPKKFACTLELDNTEIELATNDFASYGKPVAEEIEAKGFSMARMLSSAAYRDGSGICGTVATLGAPAQNASDDTLVDVILESAYNKRGWIGWFDKGDKFYGISPAGLQKVKHDSGDTNAAIDHLEVVSANRSTNTITCKYMSSAGAKVSALNNAAGATEVAAADYLIRVASNVEVTAGQFQDFTTLDASSTQEWADIGLEFIGLDGIATDQARKIHNISHGSNGDVSGTVKYCSGDPIDSQHFQQGLTDVGIACGTGRYTYKDAMMAPELYDALVESREGDRRFGSVEDSDRGTSGMGYTHRDNKIKFKTDDFCPAQQIWVIPEGDVLQYHGTDFEPMQAQGGPKWHLKAPSGVGNGNYFDSQQMFMTGRGVLVAQHPAAILKITQFVV